MIFLAQVALGVFAFLQVKNESELHAQLSQQLTTIFGKNDTELIALIQQNVSLYGLFEIIKGFFAEIVSVLRNNWPSVLGE